MSASSEGEKALPKSLKKSITSKGGVGGFTMDMPNLNKGGLIVESGDM